MRSTARQQRIHRRLQTARQSLTGSLWFFPGLIVIGAVVLAMAMIELSRAVGRAPLVERLPLAFGADAESSRSMLATIAGSVITVAGVTFSITVVAVSQASTQYTPRVLRNFMRDRPSQMALGFLVGVFSYCLIVMRTIRGTADAEFIPSLAVLGGLLLALVGIGFLVFFIHHVASSLEAGTIISRIAQETADAIDRLFPEELGSEGPSKEPGAQGLELEWRSVEACSTGYIQNVDSEGLMQAAGEFGLVVRMERGIGDFIAEGDHLLSVSGPSALTSDQQRLLMDLFSIDSYRTVYQDAAFGIRQIVDIALRALSPGVNDPTTAAICVDFLGAILRRLAGRRIEGPLRMAGGRLRVIAVVPTFSSLLGIALNEIRRNAAANARLLARMIGVLESIDRMTPSRDRKELLLLHAEYIRLSAEEAIQRAEDRQEVLDAFARFLARSREVRA